MIRFEKTNKNHIKEIMKIYNYYIEYSTATFHSDKVDKKQMKNIVYFNDNLYMTYTMFLDKKIIGYCMLAPFNKREAYKATVSIGIYINNEYVKKGYGKNAMEFLEQKALGLPIRSLIGLICTENTGSIKLFENCKYLQVGYIKKAGVKFNRLLDVVYYQKIIRPNFL